MFTNIKRLYLLSLSIVIFYSCHVSQQSLVKYPSAYVYTKTNVEYLRLTDFFEAGTALPFFSENRTLNLQVIPNSHIYIDGENININPGDSLLVDSASSNVKYADSFQNIRSIIRTKISNSGFSNGLVYNEINNIQFLTDSIEGRILSKIDSFVNTRKKMIIDVAMKNRIGPERFISETIKSDSISWKIALRLYLFKRHKQQLDSIGILKNKLSLVINDINTLDENTFLETLSNMAAMDIATMTLGAKPEELITKKDFVNYYKALVKSFSGKTKDFLVTRLWLFTNRKYKPKEIRSIYRDAKRSVFYKYAKASIPSTATYELKAENYFDMNSTLVSEAALFSQYSNRPLIIVYWASWCGPCMAKMPFIESLMAKYNKSNFIFISIDREKDAWSSAVKKLNLPNEINYFVNTPKSPQFVYALGSIPKYGFMSLDNKIELKEKIDSTIIEEYLQRFY